MPLKDLCTQYHKLNSSFRDGGDTSSTYGLVAGLPFRMYAKLYLCDVYMKDQRGIDVREGDRFPDEPYNKQRL